MTTTEPSDDPAGVLEQAYLYAYPLVLMDVIREAVTNTEEPTTERAPLNRLFHSRDLATPALTSLTRPNVDTLYSQAYLDLGEEPYLLAKPATDRYCAIQPFDGYSDTPAVLGTGGLGGDGEAVYAFTGPRFDGVLPDGVIEVPVRTDFVWLLGRVRCFGPKDVDEPHRIQDRMDLYPLSQHGCTHSYPRGDYSPSRDYIPLERMARMGAAEYFARFNALALANPGAPEDAPALEAFARLGVGAGMRFDPTALPDAAQHCADGLPGLMGSDRVHAGRNLTVVDGWVYLDGTVGRFGTDYLYRAVVAHMGFANPVEVTAYPSTFVDADDRPLSGGHSYVWHLPAGQSPPSYGGGWWSLTPYSHDGRLIPNELDRYTIDDSMPLVHNADGSLDVWISAEHPGPEREQNWLPVCPEGFGLTLRIYLPGDAVTRHEWVPPRVRRQDRP